MKGITNVHFKSIWPFSILLKFQQNSQCNADLMTYTYECSVLWPRSVTRLNKRLAHFNISIAPVLKYYVQPIGEFHISSKIQLHAKFNESSLLGWAV